MIAIECRALPNQYQYSSSVGFSVCQRFHYTAGVFVPARIGMLT